MEVSALRYSPGTLGLHGKTPLLRLQSDERLIAFIRRGNHSAFEVLVSRYQSRLLAFCRHLLGSKEDAEDVLQEVMTAAFNAIQADDRPINVRPWLYRIARNRSLNHLRRASAIGVDSMDIHLSENGASTADKVHERERFRLLVGDIQELPETQRTALVLREMDALSYDQIAEAMETTVPGVKSLLVRARIALAEAAEARQLSCADVRLELGEVAEGIRKKPDALARRHLRSCTRCSTFQGQLKKTNKALAALLPIGPLAALKQLALFHVGHSAGTGTASAGTASAGTTAAGTTAGATAGATGAGATGAATTAAGASVLGSAGSALSAGAGALAGKAAAGLAAAAIVTAGAVEATHVTHHRISSAGTAPALHAGTALGAPQSGHSDAATATKSDKAAKHHAKLARKAAAAKAAANPTPATAAPASKPAADASAPPAQPAKPADPPGRGQSTTDPTVLTSQPSGSGSGTADTSGSPDSSGTTTSSSSQGNSGTTGATGPTGPSDPSSGDSSSGDPSGSGSTTPSGTTGPAGTDPGAVPTPLADVPPADSLTGS